MVRQLVAPLTLVGLVVAMVATNALSIPSAARGMAEDSPERGVHAGAGAGHAGRRRRCFTEGSSGSEAIRPCPLPSRWPAPAVSHHRLGAVVGGRLVTGGVSLGRRLWRRHEPVRAGARFALVIGARPCSTSYHVSLRPACRGLVDHERSDARAVQVFRSMLHRRDRARLLAPAMPARRRSVSSRGFDCGPVELRPLGHRVLT